jgi:hypothetical protein
MIGFILNGMVFSYKPGVPKKHLKCLKYLT